MAAATPLTRSPLSVAEQQRLLGLLTALASYLGAPGDWGHGTALGTYTQQTLAMCTAIRNAPTEEERYAIES